MVHLPKAHNKHHMSHIIIRQHDHRMDTQGQHHHRHQPPNRVVVILVAVVVVVIVVVIPRSRLS